MDPVTVMSAAADIAAIIYNVIGSITDDGKKDFEPQGSYTTGDIEWSGDANYGYVFAHNPTLVPVNLTFSNATYYSCPTHPITIDPGTSQELSQYCSQFQEGSVTVAASAMSDTLTPGQKFASFVVRGLGVGVVATILPDINVSVVAGSTPSLNITSQSVIRSGSFETTITHGTQAATIKGQFNGNTQTDESWSFDLPSFLGLVDGAQMEQFQIDLWLDSDSPAPKRAAKVIKGRPERKRKSSEAKT